MGFIECWPRPELLECWYGPLNLIPNTVRISYQQLHSELLRVLLNTGFAPERADLCARLFADTDRDGVYTHGLNRFPRFLKMIGLGLVDIDAQPKLKREAGALER